MGLLETEIQELRVLNQRIDQGTIKPEVVNAKIAVFSQTEKRVKLYLQIMSTAAKYGDKGAVARLKNSGLIGGQIAIESSPSLQMIPCPEMDKAITREECLDFSGSAEHLTSCQGCKEFNATRNILLKQ